MKNYFCSVGRKLREKITMNMNDKLELSKNNDKTVFLHYTNEIDIIKVMNNMTQKCGR